jgi:hypothetical protein
MRKSRTLRAKALIALTLVLLFTLLAVSPVFSAESPVTISSSTWTDSAAIHPISHTDVTVVREEKSLYSVPKLDRAVAYPDVLNYIPYLRYAVQGTKGDGSDANAVIIALSGMHAANNGFDVLAKQLVAKAKKDKAMNIEVWAIDRRINNLEDLTGLNACEQAGKNAKTPDELAAAGQIINDYYYNHVPINGKYFQGFLKNKNMPYLSEFGLRVAMEDVYTLITTMFPDQNVRKKKVYVAGDSLGAVETADFAAWDFDGNAATTADAGYNNIAGVIAFDALMTTSAVPIGQEWLKLASRFIPAELATLINTTSLSTYATALAGLRGGILDVVLPTAELGYVPETYLGAEVTAMLADAAPDLESNFYQAQAPIMNQVDPRTDIMLRIAMSKDLNDFLSGVVFQKRVRWTNEALFGIALDNNFNPITMNESAMGFLAGGPVEEKTFPAKGDLDSVLWPIFWNPISGFMPYDHMYIPRDPEARKTPFTGPLYRWVNYNEISASTTDAAFARRYTTSADEVTDLHDLAKAFYDGPSNIAEWYYSTRFFLDMLIAPTKGANKYGLNILHADDMAKEPLFMRLNTHGTNIGYAKMNRISTYGKTLPGHHLDVLMMSMDKTAGNTDKKKMLLPMCDWMKTTTANVK